MGQLIVSILMVMVNLTKTYPLVAVPTILCAVIATYLDLVTKGEVAIAFTVFMTLLILTGIIIGLISKIRKSEFSNRNKTRAIAFSFALSLALSAMLISKIRSMPTFEQRMAAENERRENNFLKNYEPNRTILAIAQSATMTDYGKRLFFLSDPTLVSSAKELNDTCRTDAEHSNVTTLGCFSSRDKKIFLLDDSGGMTQNLLVVTATHELMHSVFSRMSIEEKEIILKALLDVWHGPDHKYLEQRLMAYGSLNEAINYNELHSIVGTELKNLPQVLKDHYSKYFDPVTVSRIANSFEQKLESQKKTVNVADKKIDSLKSEIVRKKKQISNFSAMLKEYKTRLNNFRSMGDISSYNSMVPMFNETVEKVKNLEDETNHLIKTYNEMIHTRNDHAQELSWLSSTEES